MTGLLTLMMCFYYVAMLCIANVFTDDRSLDVDETWAALQEYYTLLEIFETPSREEHAKLFQVE